MKNSAEKTDVLPVVAVILILAGLAGLTYFGSPVDKTVIRFPVNDGKEGNAILYIHPDLPSAPAHRPPVVFLFPGAGMPADRFDKFAGELVRRGYACCALYSDGVGKKRNTAVMKGAAQYLYENHPNLDVNRKILFGHSSGAESAIRFSRSDKSVISVTAVGCYCKGGSKEGIPNLLLGTGLYDSINGPEKVEQAAMNFIRGMVNADKPFAGSFEDRTARGFFVSPFSNHVSEIEDFVVYRKSIDWFEKSLKDNARGRIRSEGFLYHYYFISVLLFLAGSLVGLCLAGIRIFRYNLLLGKILWGGGIIILSITALLPSLSPLWSARFAGLLLLSGTAASYFSRGGSQDNGFEGFRRWLLRVSVSFLLFLISFALSRFLFSLPLFIGSPSYMWSFPGYLFVSFGLTLCSFLSSGVCFIKTFYPLVLGSVLALWIIILFVDFIGNAFWGRFIDALWKRSVRYIESGNRASLKRNAVTVMAVFLLAAAGIMISGAFTGTVIRTYIIFTAGYVICPLLIWAGLMKLTKGIIIPADDKN